MLTLPVLECVVKKKIDNDLLNFLQLVATCYGIQE